MKYFLSLIAIGVLSAFAFTSISPGYKIMGTVTGLPDHSWLYLHTSMPDQDIDSCQVLNGKFNMSGRITEKATSVYLHTDKFTDYVNFWLENKDIKIVIKAGEFKKGLITGSATEDENKRLYLLLGPVNHRSDSLQKVLQTTKDTSARKELLLQMNVLDLQGRQIEKDWVKNHPETLIAANLLDIYSRTWGKETTQHLYNNLSVEMKSTRYGQEIKDFILLNKEVKVGDKYADFEQENAAGKIVKLSQTKGKYILLDFWASWCGPCRQENPELVKTYTKFKDKGFVVFGVSLDDSKANWLKAITDDHLTWENVSDLKGDRNKVALMYGIYAIPNNFLIDENGTIIARNLRGKVLDDKLKELLP